MYQIDEAAGWYLQQGIRPSETREYEAHLHRIEMQIAGKPRANDGDIGAVKIINHHDDKEHRCDEESPLGGNHRRYHSAKLPSA